MTFSIQNPRRILLTSVHHLGDLVAKVPFIRLLKKQYPKVEVILLARSYVFPLAKCIQEIDEVHDFERLFNQSDSAIVESLKKLKCDTCIHILSVQSQIGPDVISFAKRAGIVHRIGNRCKSKWSLYRKKNYGLTHNVRQKRILPHLHEYEWNLFPLTFFGIQVDPKEVNFPKLLKTPLQNPCTFSFLNSNRVNLVIHPGSFGNAKEWPQSHFIKLIETLGDSFQIILTGTQEERMRYDFSSVETKVLDLRGRLPLNEFIHLLAQVDGLLAASTGPIHMASLFGTQTLALFPKQDALSKSIWGARGERSINFESPSICSMCQNRLTDLNPKLCTCMEGISVEQVQDQLMKWSSHENIIR